MFLRPELCHVLALLPWTDLMTTLCATTTATICGWYKIQLTKINPNKLSTSLVPRLLPNTITHDENWGGTQLVVLFILGMSFTGQNSLVDDLNIGASTGLHHSHKMVWNDQYTRLDYPHPKIEHWGMRLQHKTNSTLYPRSYQLNSYSPSKQHSTQVACVIKELPSLQQPQ